MEKQEHTIEDKLDQLIEELFKRAEAYKKEKENAVPIGKTKKVDVRKQA